MRSCSALEDVSVVTARLPLNPLRLSRLTLSEVVAACHSSRYSIGHTSRLLVGVAACVSDVFRLLFRYLSGLNASVRPCRQTPPSLEKLRNQRRITLLAIVPPRTGHHEREDVSLKGQSETFARRASTPKCLQPLFIGRDLQIMLEGDALSASVILRKDTRKAELVSLSALCTIVYKNAD